MTSWINVKDKAPNQNENLPVLLFDGNFVFISTYYTCDVFSPKGLVRPIDRVTHWMPLPEPPRD